MLGEDAEVHSHEVLGRQVGRSQQSHQAQGCDRESHWPPPVCSDSCRVPCDLQEAQGLNPAADGAQALLQALQGRQVQANHSAAKLHRCLAWAAQGCEAILHSHRPGLQQLPHSADLLQIRTAHLAVEHTWRQEAVGSAHTAEARKLSRPSVSDSAEDSGRSCGFTRGSPSNCAIGRQTSFLGSRVRNLTPQPEYVSELLSRGSQSVARDAWPADNLIS